MEIDGNVALRATFHILIYNLTDGFLHVRITTNGRPYSRSFVCCLQGLHFSCSS
jgi:hypothetical protein